MPTIPELLAEIAAKRVELEDLYELAKQVKLEEFFASVAVIEADDLSSKEAQTALQDAMQLYFKEIKEIGS